ncbi:hypothetical protein ACNJFH_21460, partial [Mycobacterium tuberculosis]
PAPPAHACRLLRHAVPAALILSAAVLAFGVPAGILPMLPGPVVLVVMAALCLAVLRGQSPLARGLALLAPVAAGLCMLAAIGWLRSWPG